MVQGGRSPAARFGGRPALQELFIEDKASTVADGAHGREALHQALGDPLAGHLDDTELRDGKYLRTGLVQGQGPTEGLHDQIPVLEDLHVDEVDDDDPADV